MPSDEFLTKMKQNTFDLQFFVFFLIIIWEFLGGHFGKNNCFSVLGIMGQILTLYRPLKKSLHCNPDLLPCDLKIKMCFKLNNEIFQLKEILILLFNQIAIISL